MFIDYLLVGLDGVLERPLLVGADVAAVVAALRLVVAVHVQLRPATRALEASPAKKDFQKGLISNATFAQIVDIPSAGRML